MTKRTNPKATPTVASTINSTAPISSVEGVKAESKARVVKKPKQANSKAPAKPRGRSKKPTVKVELPELTQQDKNARILRANVTVTQVEPETLIEPKPPLYDRFVGWLFRVTLPFRGF